ncbi:calcineurin-like phosphoesterase C-terminal domain-containing protein [Bacteroides sp.]
MKHLKGRIISFLLVMTMVPMTYATIQLPDLQDKEGMVIKGYVHNGEKPLSGVLVTNGYSFATTDENGTYYLPSDADADFVYLVTPAGYSADCEDGITQFYHPIDKSIEVYRADFQLTPTGDDTHHKFLVLGDPQMRDDHDYGLFQEQALPDIKETIKEIKKEGYDPHVLVLGDICFNTWNTYPRYVKYWEGINTSLYHCPGNHDKHIVTDKTAASLEYRAAFGPLYYSFNKGKIHYLMLDNIKITATDECTTELYPEALEWVKKDLSYVPHGTTVVVGVHQPLTWTSASKTANKTLLGLLGNYKTLILSAHKHYGLNLGKYSDTVEERIQSALCGAYWYGDVAKDGTPLGYYVYEAVGDSLCWQFKALNKTTDYQFKMYDPVPFGNNLKFDINIFDYDSNWNVTWKLGGIDKGKMFSYEAYDPRAYELYIDHQKTWCRPVKTTHMFYCTVPTTAQSVECNITDRFGRTFSQIYTMLPSGIEETHKEDVSIYPNPTSGSVTIKTNIGVKQVELFDLSGMLITRTENTEIIDLSSLLSGCYIALITLNNDNLVYKRIIKK